MHRVLPTVVEVDTTIFPFYTGGNYGTKTLSNLLKIILLLNSRAEIQTQTVWLQSPGS